VIDLMAKMSPPLTNVVLAPFQTGEWKVIDEVTGLLLKAQKKDPAFFAELIGAAVVLD
jgi:hypothetical protein